MLPLKDSARLAAGPLRLALGRRRFLRRSRALPPGPTVHARLPRSEEQSGLALEVVIPVIGKDLPTLPAVVDSIRRCLRHPLGGLYVVSPPDPAVQAFCARFFVSEYGRGFARIPAKYLAQQELQRSAPRSYREIEARWRYRRIPVLLHR